MPALRAVIFDMGNTLWFEAVAPDLDAVARLQAERIIPLLTAWRIDAPEPLEAILTDVLKDLWAAEAEAMAIERQRRTYREIDVVSFIRGALAARDIALTEDQARQWYRAAWIPVRTFGVQLYPDAIDVLRELKQLGLKVGLNTNRPCSTEMFWPDLEDFGLAPYVDAAVCSGDTGFEKPHPSTFELILRRLDVAPEEAAMVGDGCHADMAGGRAAGMRTVWKLNGRYDVPPCGDADYEIHDLSELLALPLIPSYARHPAAAESLTPHDDANADRY